MAAKKETIENFGWFDPDGVGLNLTQFRTKDKKIMYNVSAMYHLVKDEKDKTTRGIFVQTKIVAPTQEEAVIIAAKSLGVCYDLFTVAPVFDEEGVEIARLNVSDILKKEPADKPKKPRPKVVFH